MNSKVIIFYIGYVCITWSGCATLTGYQDGKTLDKGITEVGVSLNVGQSQLFDTDEDDILEVFDRVTFPNLELAGRRNITRNLDGLIRLSTTFNLGLGVKYQILGDLYSKYALSVGTEINTFGAFTTGIWNLQLPLYNSIHPTEDFAIYFSPRYIHQFSAFGGRNNWNYLGGNFGFLWGRKHKFALDAGYYRLGADKISSVGLTTIGFGGKFYFGAKSMD